MRKVERIGAVSPARPVGARTGGTAGSAQAAFGAMLRGQIQEKRNAETVQGTLNSVQAARGTADGVQAVNFSKHALARAEERGIELTPGLMDKLAGSVEKAREKGAKNILAFDSTQAFILNIPYGRVITTLSQEEMKENIFTNIDGAVLL